MTKKALITGINGQDGAYLTLLLQSKNYDVVGIMRKKTHMEGHEYLHCGPCDLHYGDVSEPDFVSSVIAKTRPDEIYNLAAQSHVGNSFKSPLTTMQVNYGGLVNIINAVKTYCPSTRIYQAGTSEMFGDSGAKMQNEETPFLPKSPYAIAKVAAHYAGINARKEGIFVSNGILFNHESPIRGEDFVTRKITLAKARGETPCLGNVQSRRDWGFAGDYVEGMWRMLQHDKPDDFVLATGETYSILDFLSAAQSYYTTNASNLRPNDLGYLCGDYSKAKAVLGWEPKVRFKQLVKMMVEEDLRRA